VRLAGDAEPRGAKVVRRTGDGAWIVECDTDPLAWIAAQPEGTAIAFEAGEPRLDDLYEMLYLTQKQSEAQR
jgi:hypothetical protein